MKPMELKEPTACCKSPTLAWSREKGYYVCPCGTMEVNQFGRLKTKRSFMDVTRRKPVTKS